MVGHLAEVAGPMPLSINSTADIRSLADSLLAERFVALDTESDSMYHYREKVCLIQLSSPGTGTVIVDPLGPADPRCLGEVMAAPEITKILHGSDFDITSLKRDFTWTFAGVFDTALAARFLGWTSFGLAAVAKRELGIDMEKGDQTSDWSIRPLPARMLKYAAGDVDYLVEIHHRLADRLAEIGRLEWVVEESEAGTQIHAASELPAPADFLKVGLARDLSPQKLAVLRELFAAREAVSLELDRPRFKVISDDALVSIAIAAPETIDAMRSLRWLPQNIARHPDRWVNAIRAGVSSPPVTVTKERRKWKHEPLVGLAVERLRVWRDKAAADLVLDPGVLLPNRLITAIALRLPESLDELALVEGIRRWRCDNFGDALVRAASGRQAHVPV